MATDGKRLVHRYFEQFLSSPGEIAIADEILAPEVVFRNPISPAGIHGVEQFKQFAQRWERGFPDRVFTVDEAVMEGDTVAVRFTITGTHRGEFMGAPPTGNRITIHGMDIFRIGGGRIREVEAFFNPADLLVPIGLASALGPSAASPAGE